MRNCSNLTYEHLFGQAPPLLWSLGVPGGPEPTPGSVRGQARLSKKWLVRHPAGLSFAIVFADGSQIQIDGLPQGVRNRIPTDPHYQGD